jgi:hypothetical protein
MNFLRKYRSWIIALVLCMSLLALNHAHALEKPHHDCVACYHSSAIVPISLQSAVLVVDFKIEAFEQIVFTSALQNTTGTGFYLRAPPQA